MNNSKVTRKVLIILGHPRTKSFCGALADSYAKGIRKSGSKVKRINLRELKFDPILWEGYEKPQDLEKDLKKAQKDIQWANHIVFVYPIWWGYMPALLKGFLDRIILPGFAFKYRKGSRIPEMFFKKKTSRIIATMDVSKLLYWIILRDCGVKNIKRSILNFTGIFKIKVNRIHKIRKMSDDEKVNWLKKIKKIGEKDGK